MFTIVSVKSCWENKTLRIEKQLFHYFSLFSSRHELLGRCGGIGWDRGRETPHSINRKVVGAVVDDINPHLIRGIEGPNTPAHEVINHGRRRRRTRPPHLILHKMLELRARHTAVKITCKQKTRRRCVQITTG